MIRSLSSIIFFHGLSKSSQARPLRAYNNMYGCLEIKSLFGGSKSYLSPKFPAGPKSRTLVVWGRWSLCCTVASPELFKLGIRWLPPSIAT